MKGLTNQRFGKLVAIKPTKERRDAYVIWECQCDCGNITKVRSNDLKRGRTKSCGCLQKGPVPGQHKNYNKLRTPTYQSWADMKKRCSNPNSINFKNYGDRDIKVCKRWLTFESFYRDMGECPKGLTLGRMNNSLGYFPDNCEWQTHKKQNNNKRNNRIIEYRGKKLTMEQWSRELNINYGKLRERLCNHWSIERAFNN